MIQALSKLMLPLIAMQFIDVGNLLIDNLMLSNYDPYAMGVVNVVGVTVFTVLVFFFGVLAMSAPLMGQANGAGNALLLGRILYSASVIAVVIMVGLFVACLYVQEWLDLMGVDAVFGQIASDYIDGRKYAFVMLVGLVFRLFLNVQKILLPSLILNLIILPINALLNWVLIYGRLGLPELGVYGAGLATGLATAISTIAIIAIALVYAHKKHIKPFASGWNFDSKIAKSILQMGIFMGVAFFIELSLFTIGNYLVVPFGKQDMTAYAILYQVWSLFWALSFGMGDGLGVYVSNEAGKRNRTNIIEAIRKTVLIFVSINVVSLGLLYVFAVDFVGLYFAKDSVDEVVRDLALGSLTVLILGILLEATSQIPAHVLKNLNDTTYLPIFQLLGYVVAGLGLAYVLGHIYGMGLFGVMLGMALGVGVTVILLWARLYYTTRKNRIFGKVNIG